MASNPRSPICRPPSDLKPGSKVPEGEMAPNTQISEYELGFVTGQPLTQQKVKIMRLQRPDVFPLCRGVDRYWDDLGMYPQYGDLQSQLFKHDRAPIPHHLQKQREILLRRHWIESVGVPSAQDKGEGRQSQEQRRLGESSGEPSRHVDGDFRPANNTDYEDPKSRPRAYMSEPHAASPCSSDKHQTVVMRTW
ncbi:hypothetical protein BDU57DRAFT_598870 [Ampelomyces quisqualis]|uniref:Uncharacterized protein n=1 Tax=Ampelomyces quisqualis TaxID=50730 RepID=A0A6A5Q9V1_AMPQU|nr:hypothetical protein BDU57DRAFT_598870 [Ampelomyces quisqualis]